MASMAKEERPRPYLAAVSRLQVHYPILKTVTSFLQRPSLHTPRLTVLEFSPQRVAQVQIVAESELHDYWSRIPASASDPASDIKGRLYLIEDLSASYLEAVGTHFNINPVFFLRHFYAPVIHKHQQLDIAQCPPQQLHCGMHQHATGMSLRYYDTFVRDGPLERWAKFTACNARRKVVVTRPFPRKDAMLTILRNISLHVVDNATDKPWSAVFLVDAPVRSHWVISEPGPGGRRDRLELCHFKPYMAPLATSADLWAKDVLTSHPTKGITIPYDEAGPFQNIIDYWARRYTSLDLATVIGNPQGVLNSVATGVILPSWMNLLSLLSATLSNHEYSMFEFEEISPNTSGKKVKSELTKLRDALGNISRTRRRAWWYIEHIHVSFQNLGYPNGRVDPQSHGHSSGHSPAIEELSVILNRFYYMKERIDSLIPIIQNACNILEAQRGALETKQFNALTSLASVFIPISTCAAIFSMGDGYLPGEANNWVFWAVALPLTTGVMLVIFNLSFMQMLAKSAVSRIEALR